MSSSILAEHYGHDLTQFLHVVILKAVKTTFDMLLIVQVVKVRGQLHILTASHSGKETHWGGHWIDSTARLDMVTKRKFLTFAMN
jgi:hypothetical protein